MAFPGHQSNGTATSGENDDFAGAIPGIDLAHESALTARLWEIKASANYKSSFTQTLTKLAGNWDRPTRQYLVQTGEEEVIRGKTQLLDWRRLAWKEK